MAHACAYAAWLRIGLSKATDAGRWAIRAGLQLPAQAHEVLRALLRRLWDARRAEPTRLPLAGALLEHLQLSRGPRLLRLPPPVLQAVLQGMIVVVA